MILPYIGIITDFTVIVIARLLLHPPGDIAIRRVCLFLR